MKNFWFILGVVSSCGLLFCIILLTAIAFNNRGKIHELDTQILAQESRLRNVEQVCSEVRSLDRQLEDVVDYLKRKSSFDTKRVN